MKKNNILLIVKRGMDKLLVRIGIWQDSALYPFQRVLWLQNCDIDRELRKCLQFSNAESAYFITRFKRG